MEMEKHNSGFVPDALARLRTYLADRNVRPTVMSERGNGRRDRPASRWAGWLTQLEGHPATVVVIHCMGPPQGPKIAASAVTPRITGITRPAGGGRPDSCAKRRLSTSPPPQTNFFCNKKLTASSGR